MKSIALVWLSFVVLLGASQAAESEIPNIVSSWKTASGAYAKAVTEFKKIPTVLSRQPLQTEFRIVKKVRLFQGFAKSSTSVNLHLGSVFSKDDKRFTTSVDKGISSGTFEAVTVNI